MNPSDLIPIPDAIPAHWMIFRILLLLTFIIHILLMNAMLGTGIIALVSAFRKDKSLPAAEKQISIYLPYFIAFTINAGVAPFLFVQVLYGHFLYTSSVLMAVYWLLVILILMIAYYAAYIYDFKFDSLGRGRTVFIGTAVVLLLSIGFIFSNNFTLMLRPEKWVSYFDNAKGTILNLSEPMLIPRYLHFIIASVAIGGLTRAWFLNFNKNLEKAEKKEQVAQAMEWFNHATLAQVGIGTWFLLSLPRDIMMVFMGKHVPSTLLFIAGMIMVHLTLVLGFKKKLAACTTSLVILVSIMAVMREIVRAGFLSPYFTMSSLELNTQLSPMLLFILVFILGIISIGYMLKLAGKEKTET